ncbi:PP2C family protein-serine/threonine phosphatase [Streptomyces sp. NPDC057257]|uniref:PP2C family protein-serine/threonine phosphatase n=1 Tax=Streptomyces sp. NPDC057257 TaxID=3346071 RepID=UPI00362F9533
MSSGTASRPRRRWGRLCTAVRTLADVDLPPDELLTQLDDLVLRLDRDAAEQGARASEIGLAEVGAACHYAVYDPVSRRCSMARADHPLPVLMTPGGAARFLDVAAGPPLGLGGLPFEVAEFELPEGSVLAFYTDGLTEGPETDAEAERMAFHEVLSASTPSLQTACDRLLQRLPPERRTDDAALLLARTKALGSDQVAGWHPGAEPSTVAEARKWVTRTLAEWKPAGPGIRHGTGRQRAGDPRPPVWPPAHSPPADPRHVGAAARSPPARPSGRRSHWPHRWPGTERAGIAGWKVSRTRTQSLSKATSEPLRQSRYRRVQGRRRPCITEAALQDISRGRPAGRNREAAHAGRA